MVDFVTGDSSLRRSGKTDPVDDKLLEACATGEGLIPIPADKVDEWLKESCRLAREVSDEFHEILAKIMTPERIKFVENLRVNEGYSWRAVAHACYDEFDGKRFPEWARVPSNQIMGIALCEVAAASFGEDAWSGRWNS